jgi:hypothetical protein
MYFIYEEGSKHETQGMLSLMFPIANGPKLVVHLLKKIIFALHLSSKLVIF